MHAVVLGALAVSVHRCCLYSSDSSRVQLLECRFLHLVSLFGAQFVCRTPIASRNAFNVLRTASNMCWRRHLVQRVQVVALWSNMSSCAGMPIVGVTTAWVS